MSPFSMKKSLSFLLMIIAVIAAKAQTKDLAVGVLGEGGTWRFLNGTEFPGATGGLEFRMVSGQPVAILQYDFSKGGRYVAATSKTELKSDVSEVRFKLKSAQMERVAVRFRDSSGQYHQFALAYSSPGEWQTLRQPVADVKSSIHFQGNNDGVIAFPIVEFFILINSPSKETKTGEVWLSGMTALR